MKTTQDFNGYLEEYSAEIEQKIANLNRMRDELQSSCAAAQQIINELEPVLAKLHLTIDEFIMRYPDKEKAANSGVINFILKSDGKFRFIKFAGYTSRGEERNKERLLKKAKKINETVMTALKTPANELCCSVYSYSLEISSDREEGHVYMSIYYNF